MWPNSAIKNIPAVRQARWGIPLIPELWGLSLMLSFWLLQPGLITNFVFHTHHIWTLVVEIMAVLFPFFSSIFLKYVCFHLYMEVGGQPWVSFLPRHHSRFYACLLVYFIRLNYWSESPQVFTYLFLPNSGLISMCHLAWFLPLLQHGFWKSNLDLALEWQALYPLNCLPSLLLFLKLS